MSTRLYDYYRFFRSSPSAWIFLGIIVALSFLGLVILSTATQSFTRDASFFNKQLQWMVIAVCGCFAVAAIDVESYRKVVWWIAGITILLLLVVLVPQIGVKVNGARRWLDFGHMRLQAAEPAKFGMVLVLAHYLAANQREIKSFLKGFFFPALWVGGLSFLILLEPDFGTAFLTGIVGFMLMFLAGTRILYLVPSLLGAVSLFSVAIYFDPVRRERITSFLDVEANKADGAYQLLQGMLAFGAGGLQGEGLGNGRQQLSFLPEAHTDFIFSVIGEELGFFCTSAVALAYLGILVLVILHLRNAPNLYQFTIVTGALLFLSCQALINMAVVTGCIPTKGMSLPFISYGGSNLVLMLAFCGPMFNCFREWSRPPVHTPRDL